MFLGVDYYPEHWNEDMLEEDLNNIIELGSNVIRIGEFAWHMMESEEGKFDFSYFDHVINEAKKKGLKVIFGTPTATMPAWLAKKHPDVLGEFEDNTKRVFGGRRQYCFNSKTYYKYSETIIRELANYFKDEEAIVAWQIDNEFGHEGSDVCYCNECKKVFREYLRKAYNNDIDKLNEIWGTRFWSQTYNDFEEIPIPAKTITTHNPSLRMEWERFRSLSVENYAKFQVEILKEILGEDSVIIHDFSGGYFDKSFDFSKVAKHIDVVAYNNYPVWGGQKEPIPPHEIACGLDFMRGAKRQNFWITEAIMGAQGHDVIGYLPRPNQAKMWSYQAMAHGCNSLMYFRYRGATKGAEQYCYGIIDQDNRKRRKFYEVQDFFKDMKENEHIINSEIKSEVAVIYDYESMASFRIQRQSFLMDYKKEVYRLYRPFYENNINIDVIPSYVDFNEYKVLLIPTMVVFKPKVQERIKEFVKNGGKVVFSFRTAVKDYYNNLTLGELNPSFYNELIGGFVEEVESLQEGQKVKIKGIDEFIGIEGSGTVFRDMLKTTTSESLFMYDDEFFNELSAITLNKYGDGEVYYIGTGVDNNIMNIIAKKILSESNIEVIESEEGIEVVKRKVNNEEYYFIMNHTALTKEFNGICLSSYESKIIKR
ncbi:beta-galactosidase [Clostridium sp.]|uniref:beta-galactosidase n=1 Tax=Clostridium sp. TaxID=1506 RepID=UPI0025BE26B3|nr:beta-galactosidase [Clostridium sp.]MBS4956797.1 beta-galactosidase [Clostridium sp.]MDU4883056.1 beta-galactosidase [Clostridium celatum]MDU7076224.1 beta-galactosidase [Clostridium celatum]